MPAPVLPELRFWGWRGCLGDADACANWVMLGLARLSWLWMLLFLAFVFLALLPRPRFIRLAVLIESPWLWM